MRGNVEYFNVSKALVEKGESITFKCGGTRERGQDGEVLSLTLHIRKWFNGSSEKWLLAVNEQVEVANDFERYNAVLHQKEQIREVEFTILDAEPGDTGYYTCYTDRKKPNITVFVDVLSQPVSAVLKLDSDVVGQMVLGEAHQASNISGERRSVNLGQSYVLNCLIEGGNPPPNVTLASGLGGGKAFEGVVVTQKTDRNADRRLSVPWHLMNATLHWTATAHDIGRPLVCSAGVDNHRAVWAQFVPIVDTRAPLFGCPDKVELKAGDNDLIVPCRIVSIHDPLMSIRVRVYDQTGMNFTIEPEMIESDVTTLERYIVRTAHSPLTHSWNVTLQIMNAATVTDLDSHKVEFVAETHFEQGIHSVSIGLDTGASSRITVSMATLLLTMVLGAFCRP